MNKRKNKHDLGKLTGIEHIVADLDKVSKASPIEEYRETAKSLLLFYLRNKTLTVKQMFIAKQLIK